MRNPEQFSSPDSEEEKQEAARTSGIIRIAGVSPEKEGEILHEIKEQDFDVQEIDKKEREKTPEEVEIISGVLAAMPAFVRKHGGSPVPIKLEHIHIIDPDKLTDEEKASVRARGWSSYSPQKQRIFLVRGKTEENKLQLAHETAHEMVHFNAFQSASFNPKEEIISVRTRGLAIKTKEGEEGRLYFRAFDEAITEELVKRFDKECFGSIPGLAEELSAREKVRADWLAERTQKGLKGNSGVVSNFVVARGESGADRIIPVNYSYAKERRKLKEIMEGIQKGNPEKFKTREDVFNVFEEAYFTGKKVKIARLIEKTYGKGAFRKLGEETKNLSGPDVKSGGEKP